MTLSFQVAQTAGTTVLLVTSPVSKELQPQISQRLLSLRELPAQRVAYLSLPRFRSPASLDFAEGIFSASASACAGLLCAIAQGFRREKKLMLDVAGLSSPCPVHANPLTGQVSLSLPLPDQMKRETLANQAVSLLSFPGLAHVVSSASLPDREILSTLLPELTHSLEAPVVQWNHWDPTQHSLTALRLHQDGTLTEESASLSGFAAAALCTARGEGTHKLEWSQPSGTVHAAVTVHHGTFQRLLLTVPVLLGQEYEISF